MNSLTHLRSVPDNLVSARGLRFTGMVNQLTQERDEANLRYKKSQLEALTLEVSGQKLNGLQLLSLCREISQFPMDIHPGKSLLGIALLGIPFMFKSFRKSTHFIPENAKPRLNVQELMRLFSRDDNKQVGDLAARLTGVLFGMHGLGLLVQSPTSNNVWIFQDAGLQILERFGNEVSVGKDRVTFESIDSSEDVKRAEQLKLLISLYSDGKSGWKQLEHIQSLFDGKRGLLGVFSRKDVTHSALLKHLQLGDAEKQGLIADFKKMGLLADVTPSAAKSQKPGREETVWMLTPKARSILQQGDPLETASVNPPEWRRIIGLEVDRLKAEKRQRESNLISVEHKYDQALNGLAALRKEQDSLERQAVSIFEASKLVTDFEERSKLQQQASEKAFDARCTQDKIALEEETAEKLKAQVQGTKTLLAAWTRKTNQTIQLLLRIETQLKNVQVFKDITGLSEQLQKELPSDGQAVSLDSNPVLASLSKALGEQYYKPQSLADPSEIDVASRANQSHQAALLEQNIKTIQGRLAAGGSLDAQVQEPGAVENPNEALEALARKLKQKASG